MTDGQYRLLVADLQTDTKLGYVDISGVSFDSYLDKSGSLSGTVAIPNSTIAARVRDILLPGRTMLYLERNRVIEWGGVLWSRTRQWGDRSGYSCAVQAASLESVLRGHRLLTADQTAVGADQFAIVRQLITWAQAQPGGNLGIEMDASLSGVLRDRTYSRYDLPWIGQLIDQLAATEDGFEWRIQVYRDDSGVRHRALRLGYPKLTYGSTDMILKSPGKTMTAYSLPEDGTLMATAWQSRGASTGQDSAAEQVPLMSALLEATADFAAGWPRLDGTSDYSTVESQTILDQHARADFARAARPVAVPSVSYDSSTLGRPQLGTYVTLSLLDTWNPTTTVSRYRVIGFKTAPTERGKPESTDLFLEVA